MKRDYDLIRLILIDIENNVQEWSEAIKSRAGKDTQVINGHVELLVDHGEVKYPKDPKTGRHQVLGNGYWMPMMCKLTMEGHDLLDDIRDPSVFKKLKDKVNSVGGQVSLHVFKTLAAETFKSAIGL
ncbi:MAG: DUF2513 domain-containing protein [Ignavibacteriae bacterium]|nr:DUF2513 domain-containing protein [Ignavibacteriota bacterium]MCB9216165.1 DUF2513 domain-containing protein [Ignavibacteria bacterium]